MDQAQSKPELPGTGRRLAAWWPAVIPLLAIPTVYLATAVGADWLVAKRTHEVLALALLPVALAACAVRLAIRRDRLHLVLAVAVAALLCREIHFPGAKPGFYAAAAGIAVWSVFWRQSLLKGLLGRAKGRWFVLTGWAYLFALLIQRRALRFLPAEGDLHVQMEEVAESIAHAFVIVLGIL